MATKGTAQYNVWKAKYEATKLRKSGQLSLFSEDQVNSMISAVVGNLPKVETHPLQYFESNIPAGLQQELWQKAALRATKDGSKEVAFSAVRAIYNVYLKRQRKVQAEKEAERKARFEHMMFCRLRAETEIALEEMFNV